MCAMSFIQRFYPRPDSPTRADAAPPPVLGYSAAVGATLHRQPSRGRSRRQIVLAATACSLLIATTAAVPSWARALGSAPPPTRIATITLPGGGGRSAELGRTPRSVVAPIRANLVGVSWLGAPTTLALRARGRDHRWSRWVPLHADLNEGPDLASRESQATRARHVVPMPVWVGDATRFEFRSPAGTARDVRITVMNTTGTASRLDRIQAAARHTAAMVLGSASTATATPARPDINTRAAWGADESIRRGDPAYADTVKAAVVHHTVTANSYSRSDVPAIMRGIYTYHVQSNGWNDIGYNFVVDRFGRTWEGRYGGVTRPVIGAHAGGFNTATTGIALLGTHSSARPPRAARRGLASLLSWRLDLAHVDPTRSTTLVSGGNDKYPAGTVVTKRAVSGHRDLYSTECPGAMAYGLINRARRSAWRSGGPKIASPTAATRLTGTGATRGITVSAHANQPVSWRLLITRSSTGGELGSVTASSSASTSMSWDTPLSAADVPAWDLRWRLTATAGATAARPAGAAFVEVPPPPRLHLLSRSADIMTPNGDGRGDTTVAKIRMSQRVRLVATVATADAPTTPLRTLSRRVRGAGRHTITWDGTINGAPAPEGRYVITTRLDDPIDGRIDPELSLPVGLDRHLEIGAVSDVFSPGTDGVTDTIDVPFSILGAGADITLTVHRPSRPARRVLAAEHLSGGDHHVTFDGRDDAGAFLRDGTWIIELTSDLPVGLVRVTALTRIDVHAPAVTAVRLRSGALSVHSNERARISGRIRRDGHWSIRRLWINPGTTTTRSFPGTRSLIATDVAGNQAAVKVRRRR